MELWDPSCTPCSEQSGLFDDWLVPIGVARDPYKLLKLLINRFGKFITTVALYTLRPAAWIWERYLTSKLLQIMSSPAFGLEAHEFVNSLVIVENQIRRPDIFAEYVWPVTARLMKGPEKRQGGAQGRVARYAFLWDDRELEARKKASWLWRQRTKWIEDVYSRYARFPEVRLDNLEERLARACLVLEEQFKEIAGIVELGHSAYYSNPEIIEATAEFIAYGRTPPDATMEYGIAQFASKSVYQIPLAPSWGTERL